MDLNLGRITNKVGPLPAWAWAAIPAVGYIAYSYYRASQDIGIEPGSDVTSDGTEPDYGINTGGIPSLPGYTANPAGTSNLPYIDNPQMNNVTWMRQAINYLISEGVSASDANTAINAYLFNSPSSINQTQMNALQKAIARFGPPYEGSPGTFPTLNQRAPDVVTKPFRPTTVVAHIEKNGARLTWTPPQSNGGSPIIGYQAKAYVVGKDGKWKVVKQYNLLPTARNALFTNLKPGVVYSLNVSARNVKGYGPEGWDHVTLPSPIKVT